MKKILFALFVIFLILLIGCRFPSEKPEIVEEKKEEVGKEMSTLERYENLCEMTNGTWKEEQIKCECPLYLETNPKLYYDLGKFYFIRDRGCVSLKVLCEEKGGFFEKPKVKLLDFSPDIPETMCVTSSIYTLRTWDEDKKICITARITEPIHRCLVRGKEITLG